MSDFNGFQTIWRLNFDEVKNIHGLESIKFVKLGAALVLIQFLIRIIQLTSYSGFNDKTNTHLFDVVGRLKNEEE